MSAWMAAPVVSDILSIPFQQDAQRHADHENRQAAARNAQLQREFAQNSIRWKVEDARRAGINPLAALGAPTVGASPVHMGVDRDDTLPNAMRNVGQDISRAVQATRTADEQELAKLNLMAAKADVDGKVLDNQIRASQLQKLTAPQTAFPGSDNFLPGQGNSPLVNVKPVERSASQPGRPAQEAGWRPDVAYSRTDTGLTPMVPSSLSESLEDDLIGKALWRIRNQLVPNLTNDGKPPKSQLPPGASDWQWHAGKQEWQPVDRDRRPERYKQLWDDMTYVPWFSKFRRGN